ncbi:hypothetical protein [Phytohabitans rumicis]|nr:hypothetical protein [Phytohabitans rumicis]
MTAGLREQPLTTTPEAVAEVVVRAVWAGRRQVWVPGRLRPVMVVLRHLPGPLFRRLGR